MQLMIIRFFFWKQLFGLLACESLYADFQSAMSSSQSHLRPVTLLDNYASLCADAAVFLDTLLKRIPPGQAR